MKVSQKLGNACRVMILLAREDPNRPVCRVEDLAAREGLSANFLLQILNDLRRAGLVVSKRGKHGGYALARPPHQITLRQIVVAVDGSPLELEGAPAATPAAQAANSAWRSVAARFDTLLDETSLESLAAPKDAGAGMFYI